MRLELFLASFLISFSNEARIKHHAYSFHEDELIINELRSEIEINAVDKDTWKRIAKIHAEKVKENAPGFQTHRTHKLLRQHFGDVIQRKKFPKTVRHLSKSHAYTPEEEKFINREVLSFTGDLHKMKNWIKMAENHEELRRSGVHGFSIKRTPNALNVHFRKSMIPNGQVDEEVKEKYPNNFKNEFGEYEFARGPSGSKYLYSPEEDELIFKELEFQASNYNNVKWDEIAKAHEDKLQANSPGFCTSRTHKHIRQHFFDTLRHRVLPEAVRRFYEKLKYGYSVEEENFINMALRTCTGGLHSMNTWIEIAKLHDEYRESNHTGFIRRRTWSALARYFRRVMMPNDRVDDAVKKRFPRSFQTEQGENSSGGVNQFESGQGDDMECDNEGDDIWNSILKEMEDLQQNPVDEYGVDRSLFQDPRAGEDYNIFESRSPYELRTFEPVSP